MNQNKRNLLATIVLRLAVGGVAFLALGGPSPGFIGGCGSNAPPNRYDFCIQSEYQKCAREAEAGRLDATGFAACYDGVPAYCESRRDWGTCTPTNAAVSACLSALGDTNRYPTPSNEIVECSNLCAASGI